MVDILDYRENSATGIVILSPIVLLSLFYTAFVPVVYLDYYQPKLGVIVSVTCGIAISYVIPIISSQKSKRVEIEDGFLTIIVLIATQLSLAPTQIMGFLPGVNAVNLEPELSRGYLLDIPLPIILLLASELLSIMATHAIYEYVCEGSKFEKYKNIVSIFLFLLFGLMMLLAIQELIGISIGIIVTYISGLMLITLSNILRLKLRS